MWGRRLELDPLYVPTAIQYLVTLIIFLLLSILFYLPFCKPSERDSEYTYSINPTLPKKSYATERKANKGNHSKETCLEEQDNFSTHSKNSLAAFVLQARNRIANALAEVLETQQLSSPQRPNQCKGGIKRSYPHWNGPLHLQILQIISNFWLSGKRGVWKTLSVENAKKNTRYKEL